MSGELILVVGIALFLYFIPTIIAFNRSHIHSERWMVFLINLFFGWSILGWVASLVIACANTDPQVEGSFSDKAVNGLLGSGARIKQCASCAETIKEAAVVCRFCGRPC